MEPLPRGRQGVGLEQRVEAWRGRDWKMEMKKLTKKNFKLSRSFYGTHFFS